MQLRALAAFGVEVRGVSAASVGEREVRALADALEQHELLWLRARVGDPPLTPAQLRKLNSDVHAARWPSIPCAPPSKASPPSAAADGNLRGRHFPGYPETSVLGFAEAVEGWHGLSGRLEPSAWWERKAGQFHHDGGFSASAPSPPVLVGMHCHEAPTGGGGGGKPPPGATLFLSTRRAMDLAPAAVAARARRLRCVYREGFGRVREGEYPVMSESMLTPLRPPAEGAGSGHRSVTEFESFEALSFGDPGSTDADAAFCHRLVQLDSLGREFAVVHSVCVDRLEEVRPSRAARSPLPLRPRPPTHTSSPTPATPPRTSACSSPPSLGPFLGGRRRRRRLGRADVG